MKLLFSTTGDVVSRAIRIATWSRFSHVDIIDEADSDYLIGAVPFKGVTRYLMADRLVEASEIAVYSVPQMGHLDSMIACNVAMSQLGRRYDWPGVVGLGIHRDWSDDSAWFCSELVSWAALLVGFPLINPAAAQPHRITPQMLLESLALQPYTGAL